MASPAQSPYVPLNNGQSPVSTPTKSPTTTPTKPPPMDPVLLEELGWKSVVLAHNLTLELAAIDIDTDRVLYHMELTLATPLPATALQHTQYLGLTWPYGGLWKIEKVSADNSKITCISWRKTDLSQEQVDALAADVSRLAEQLESSQELTSMDEENTEQGTKLPTLFEWKMMRGEWEKNVNHWFIRDVERPVIPVPQPFDRPLIAKLFVGFQPLEARIDVNAVTAIDTVAQTYSADVTWQVKLPAITSLREDTALREFLDILEIDANQFEFTNINEIHEERDLLSSVTQAGEVQFRDLTITVNHPPVTESVFHLIFRRRIVASFTEEMALHHFPFDQQKLAFDFSTGSTGMPDLMLRLQPAPVDPGTFSVENFQLGNVFNVAYHNKVFVCELQETGPKKSMSFEMVVERRSAYYLTNVALISAIITYLSFITWAPQDNPNASADPTNSTLATSTDPLAGKKSDNSLVFMDASSRLQIVTALVLTAVTFKNQVASLVPQISYFTMLDKYVFVCFIVTSLVTLENALFAMFKKGFGLESLEETGFLGFSVGLFTIVNLVWWLYIQRWLKRRRQAARVLQQVHEYIRVISEHIPGQYRALVLHKFLESKNYPEWCQPKYCTTVNGDIHVQAPDDGVRDAAARLEKRAKRSDMQRLEAEKQLPVFRKMVEEIRPSLEHRSSMPDHLSPAMRRNVAMVRAFNPRARRRVRRPTEYDYEVRERRSVSAHTNYPEHVVDIPAFRSLQAKANSAKGA